MFTRQIRCAGCVALTLALIGAGRAVAQAYPHAWERQFGSSAYDQFRAVDVDDAGNVYAAGGTAGLITGVWAGSTDLLVRKYDPDGNVLWTLQDGSPDFEWIEDIAVDSTGAVWICGRTSGSLYAPAGGGSNDAFVARIDADGDYLWSAQIDIGEDEQALALAIDSQDRAVVVGEIFKTTDARAAFWTRFDADGTQDGGLQLLETPENDSARCVTIDALDRLYISGFTNGALFGPNAGGSDVFVAAYNADDSPLYMTQIGSVEGDVGRDLAVNAEGAAYVVGSTSGGFVAAPVGDSDAFVVKLDPAGAFVNAAQLSPGRAAQYSRVRIDCAGYLIAAGHVDVEIEGSGGLFAADAFVTRFDDLTPLWSETYGASDDIDRLEGLALDADGAGFVVAGVTEGDLFETSVGDGDAIVVKSSASPSLRPQILTWTYEGAFLAIAAPNDVETDEGAALVFTATAAGDGLSYQWERDGTPLVDDGRISGATTLELTVSDLTEADNGAYRFVVTNACGEHVSDVANLTVISVSTGGACCAAPAGLSLAALLLASRSRSARRR